MNNLKLADKDGDVYPLIDTVENEVVGYILSEDRAEVIVRAVNSHAALLAAAKRMKFATMKGFEGEPQDEKEIGLAWEQLTNAIAQEEGKP